MTIEIKNPKFELGQSVSIKFAGSDFGEWDYEKGIITNRHFDMQKDKWLYNITDSETDDKYTNVPEHQLS